MNKYIPPPLLKKAKQIDLVTYFRTYMPYELVKVSNKEYTTKLTIVCECLMDYGIGVQEVLEGEMLLILSRKLII